MTESGEQTSEIVPGVPLESPLGKAFASSLEAWLSLHSVVPRRLYHYTRLEGLEGIVRSTSFWASHAEYLNDASELRYASSLIEDLIREEGAEVMPRGRIREAMTARPELAAPLIMGERPFVVCFCENGDLLSQWRGYGAGGPAYALGLDLSHLAHARDLPLGTVLRRVIYDRDEQERLVRKTVHSWLAAVEQEIQGGRSEESVYPYPALWILQRMLIELYLCFKNPGFAEEKEWRLIKLVDVREEVRHASDQLRNQRLRAQMARTREQMREAGVDRDLPEWPEFPPASFSRRAEGLEVKFRPSSFGVVPYIDIPLKDRAGIFTGRLPLWEVIHGPTTHPELALQSLILYLDAHDYGFHTEVTPSQIPLRGD